MDYLRDFQTKKFYNIEEYFNFLSKNKNKIKSTKIIPAKIGSTNFGGLEVELDSMYYNE